MDFREIKKELFWGFVDRKTRYSVYRIAEPEKALLDWVYFRINDGLPVQLDELELRQVSSSRLHQYAKKFPRSVLDSLMPALFDKKFADDIKLSHTGA